MSIKQEIIIRSPKQDVEFADYYSLRWKILRQPWGQMLGSEKDEFENVSIHRIAILNNVIVAVARLHFIENNSAQIRYMAVAENYEKKGLGTLMLEELEKIAIEKNIETIYLHSRGIAVAFYKKQGYSVIKKSHLLFNEIQHFKMIKVL